MKKIILLFLFIAVGLYAQSAPSARTSNYKFRQWGDGANPSADSLNYNWILADTYLNTIQDSMHNSWTKFLIKHDAAGDFLASSIDWLDLTSSARSGIVQTTGVQSIGGNKTFTSLSTFGNDVTVNSPNTLWVKGFFSTMTGAFILTQTVPGIHNVTSYMWYNPNKTQNHIGYSNINLNVATPLADSIWVAGAYGELVGNNTWTGTQTYTTEASTSHKTGITASTFSNGAGYWTVGVQAGAGLGLGYTGSGGTHRAFFGAVYNNTSNTIANAAPFWSEVQSTFGSGVITDAYNFYGTGIISAATITNYYGLYLADFTDTNITNYYGIYQADSSASNVYKGSSTFNGAVLLDGIELTTAGDGEIINLEDANEFVLPSLSTTSTGAIWYSSNALYFRGAAANYQIPALSSANTWTGQNSFITGTLTLPVNSGSLIGSIWYDIGSQTVRYTNNSSTVTLSGLSNDNTWTGINTFTSGWLQLPQDKAYNEASIWYNTAADVIQYKDGAAANITLGSLSKNNTWSSENNFSAGTLILPTSGDLAAGHIWYSSNALYYEGASATFQLPALSSSNTWTGTNNFNGGVNLNNNMTIAANKYLQFTIGTLTPGSPGQLWYSSTDSLWHIYRDVKGDEGSSGLVNTFLLDGLRAITLFGQLAGNNVWTGTNTFGDVLATGEINNSSKQSISIAGGTTSLTDLLTSNIVRLAGAGSSSTLSTITGNEGKVGVYYFIFANNLITITDNNSHASNTVDLSAAFTSAADMVLALLYDGTSWYEVSRSAN